MCTAIWNSFPTPYPTIDLPILSYSVDLCLIWPQDPFPILYCPVLMVLSIFQSLLSMYMFQHWCFFLCCRIKPIAFQDISDCLRCDWIGNDGVDVLDGLNSVVRPSSSDLSNNGLFITRSELERSSSQVVLLVPIHLITDSIDSPLPHTSSGLNFTVEIALIEKGKHRRVFSSGSGSYCGG